MILIGVLYCRQGESSWMHIWIEPSPVTQTTSAPGLASLIPSAYGRPTPIVPRPPELIQPRGCSKLEYCHAHNWCWPTSEVTYVSRSFVSSHSFSITCCGLMTSA